MRLHVTHPNGSEFSINGSQKKVATTLMMWWNANENIEPEPQKQGSFATVEHAGHRYFESEGAHQEVPIIQSGVSFPEVRAAGFNV